ncbi:MAG: hypothetical protein NVSMB39_6030 [Candidatus Saccharimonadales bacterium]
MPYTGTKYDHSVCSTVKCNHGRDMHAANPRNANEPRHCTTPGCRCGAFRPTPIRRTPPPPEAILQFVSEIEDRRHHRTKAPRNIRAVSLGRSA